MLRTLIYRGYAYGPGWPLEARVISARSRPPGLTVLPLRDRVAASVRLWYDITVFVAVLSFHSARYRTAANLRCQDGLYAIIHLRNPCDLHDIIHSYHLRGSRLGVCRPALSALAVFLSSCCTARDGYDTYNMTREMLDGGAARGCRYSGCRVRARVPGPVATL